MIAIGILLAFPMLNLMLWWFGGVDPLGLTKPTNAVLPFIVPNEFKEAPEVVQPELVNGDSNELPTPQRNSADGLYSNSKKDERAEDGRLPTPKIDPSSVRFDGS